MSDKNNVLDSVEESLTDPTNDSLDEQDENLEETLETSDENNKETEETKEETIEENPPKELDERDQKIKDLNYALSKERSKKRELKETLSDKKEGEETKDIDDGYTEYRTDEDISRIKEEVKKGILDDQYKVNERIAIEDFCNEHSELLDDKNWYKMMASYKESYGKASKEAIERNLLEAYGKFSNGNAIDKAREDGRKDAIGEAAKAAIANTPSYGQLSGQEREEVLTGNQQAVINKGKISSKEYRSFDTGETFELPIHEKVK